MIKTILNYRNIFTILIFVGILSTGSTYALTESVPIFSDGGTNSGTQINPDGSIKITNPSSNGIIDFRNLDTDDFDARIKQTGNGIQFLTGGNGATPPALLLDDSQNVVVTSGKKLFLDSGGGGGDTYITETTGDKIDVFTGGLRILQLKGDQVDVSVTANKGFSFRPGGAMEITSNINTALIDFKNLDSDDFDVRIIQAGNGLRILTGGNGAASTALLIDGIQNISISSGKKLSLDGGFNTYIIEGAPDQIEMFAGGIKKVSIGTDICIGNCP